jgi:iron complex outermembrane receptor protein
MKQIFLPLVVSGIAWPCLAQTSTDSADLPERSKTLGDHRQRRPAQLAAHADSDHHRRHHARGDRDPHQCHRQRGRAQHLPSSGAQAPYGDYNHAILSTRASGTGNSARSAVYADGILLSNYLGNGIANGSNYAPRWGLVTPEEIERVDVMYGRSRPPTRAIPPAPWWTM